MSHEDFDIESLASYLHLIPHQVARMADRGQLPGRRIGGKWRFSRAEIHHWLEERIGVSDEEELIEVEGVLDREKLDSDEDEMSILGLMPLAAIQVPLLSRTKNSVIEAMVQVAATTGKLWDPEKMAAAVRARENLHPTALGNGVALLHPRRPLPGILSDPLLAFGRTHQGIPFGGDHGGMTDLFFLICSVNDREHLRLLARLSRLLADSTMVSELRAAENAAAARQLIGAAEARLQ